MTWNVDVLWSFWKTSAKLYYGFAEVFLKIFFWNKKILLCPKECFYLVSWRIRVIRIYFKGIWKTSANFRKLPQTSANFRKLPQTSANFRKTVVSVKYYSFDSFNIFLVFLNPNSNCLNISIIIFPSNNIGIRWHFVQYSICIRKNYWAKANRRGRGWGRRLWNWQRGGSIIDFQFIFCLTWTVD